MKRIGKPAAIALAVALMGSGAAAAAPVSTVDDVSYSNAGSIGRWFMGASPSLLRVTESTPLAANVREALANYDRVAALSQIRSPMRAESLRRAAYLRLRMVESELGTPEDLATSIAQYRRVLEEMPDDAANDLALYQLARAEQLAGDNDAMLARLAELDRRYPQSPLRAEALFRAAETQYLRRDYAAAEHNYADLVAIGPSAPQFEAAQYKYGWSLYQQGKHEEAIPVFSTILARQWPSGVSIDTALSGPAKTDDLAAECLRVISLSFSALGGGPAINRHLAAHGDPPYFVALYGALGAQLLDQQRYSDAAQTYVAFVERYPQHEVAPRFDDKAIGAYRDGGFTTPMQQLQERYIARYAPGAAYWANRKADPAVLAAVRTQLDTLAAAAHARAQSLPLADTEQRTRAFDSASSHYRRRLELFPEDAAAARTSMLLADSLLDARHYGEAAAQYERSAYSYPAHPQSADAAYAAVQAWQQSAEQGGTAQRDAALRSAVASSLRLAEQHPQHPQRDAAITRAAQNRALLADHAGAIELANKVVGDASAELKRAAWTVIADAQFATSDYGAAETSYSRLLGDNSGADAASRLQWSQRLAASLYKRGESARDASRLAEAAALFERAALAAPDPAVRAAADYDAASSYFKLEDWSSAQRSLERFLARNPQHALAADAESRLALVYERADRIAAAAAIYGRIAERTSHAGELRREAAWRSATLFDRAQQRGAAIDAYSRYVSAYAQSLPVAQRARQRLAEYGAGSAEALRWQREILDADERAGSRDAESRQLAAMASLALGRNQMRELSRMPLRGSLQASLTRRLQHSKEAIALLDRAAGYGYADTTTAAVYELGSLYRDLAKALMSSERPAQLSGDELEQYELLLEEQAFPFEEKAIAAYESNLARVDQDLWNEWVRRSATALAELVPARYGKQDEREVSYGALF